MAELQKAPWPDWETVRLIDRGSFGTVYEIQRKLVATLALVVGVGKMSASLETEFNYVGDQSISHVYIMEPQ